MNMKSNRVQSLQMLLSALLLVALIALLGADVAAESPPVTQKDDRGLAVALFAGGCFWCMEPPFDRLPGVTSTTSGYAGGRLANPTYQQVSSGRSGHIEVVQVEYDPALVSYDALLEVFWRNIDPLAVNRQFCDGGSQYRSAIFALDDEQRRLAEASKHELAASGRFDAPIATEILAAAPFYPAEEYHQDYYRKNPLRYKFYRQNCGRDKRLKQLWGDAARPAG